MRKRTHYGIYPTGKVTATWDAARQHQASGVIIKKFQEKSDAEYFATHGTTQPPQIPEGRTLVYTDGSCMGGRAGLGVLVVNTDKSYSEPFIQHPITNNRAELWAIRRALQVTSGPVTIRTDSKYSIKVLEGKWRAKDNRDLILPTRRAMEGRDIVLEWVSGHSGVKFNERVDMLAKRAALAPHGLRSRQSIEQSPAQ
jgi:ribonuclease HI